MRRDRLGQYTICFAMSDNAHKYSSNVNSQFILLHKRRPTAPNMTNVFLVLSLSRWRVLTDISRVSVAVCGLAAAATCSHEIV